MLKKPASNLYNNFYQNYINNAPENDILKALEQQQVTNFKFFSSISEEKSKHRYQDDKWSIKELIGHIGDTERIFNYRALSFARNEQTALPGFDENSYVNESFFSDRTFASILAEYQVIRQSTLSLLTNFSERVWERIGDANGSPMVLAAIPYIIYGHEDHHLRILKERYL